MGLAVFFHVLKDLSRRDDSRRRPGDISRPGAAETGRSRSCPQLLPGEADFVEIVLIRVDQPALEVLAEHVERQALDQRAVAGFRMPRFIVRPLSTDRIRTACSRMPGLRSCESGNPGPLLERFDRRVLVREVHRATTAAPGACVSNWASEANCRFAARRRSERLRSVHLPARQRPARWSQPIRRRNGLRLACASRSQNTRLRSASRSISRILIEG